ncbi:MAG: hypothetical protein ACMG6H_06870 [Acidobacteriota bacterium]
MLDLVRRNFATATDLADALVRDVGLSFREAHHLVGAVVRTALNRSLTADRIDAALVAEEAQALLGRRITLADDVVRRAVDPAQVAESRRGTGGPGSEDMAKMLTALAGRLHADEEEDSARRAKVAAAEAQLAADFRALAA